jgi:hypothetical protein
LEQAKDAFRTKCTPAEYERWEALGGSIGAFTYGPIDILSFSDALRQGVSFSFGGYCSIGPRVKLYLCYDHNTRLVTTFPFSKAFPQEWPEAKRLSGHPLSRGSITIGHDVWLGAEASIMSGVKIGHGAVISHRAVVTKDVGPYEIWGGVPAKKIKSRFDEETVKTLLRLAWWNLPVDRLRRLIPLLMSQDVHGLIRQLEEASDSR